MTTDPVDCDLAVFSAHPDDAELCCGGLLLVSAAKGWRTAVVDMTRGELGSLGSMEDRAREAAEAAEVLGLTCRLNLGLPDGKLHDCDAFREQVVRAVRQLRPRLVVAPPLVDHHPDHMATAELVRQSFYLCGIRRYLPDVPAWRPRGLLYMVGLRSPAPSLLVDVSDVADRRLAAIKCYRSQFEPPDAAPRLRLNSSFFLDSVTAHLRHWGATIGVPLAEPYWSETPLPVADPAALFGNEPWADRGR